MSTSKNPSTCDVRRPFRCSIKTRKVSVYTTELQKFTFKLGCEVSWSVSVMPTKRCIFHYFVSATPFLNIHQTNWSNNSISTNWKTTATKALFLLRRENMHNPPFWRWRGFNFTKWHLIWFGSIKSGSGNFHFRARNDFFPSDINSVFRGIDTAAKLNLWEGKRFSVL